MKKVGIIIALVIAVPVIVGAVLLTRSSPSSTTTNDQSANTPPPTPTATAPVLVTYTNSGFSPIKVTVKAGTRITIMNNSSNQLQFNSDNHPTHTNNTEFNVGEIKPGEDKTFAVTKIGEWGYHNHLNATDKGTIVVQ